MLCQDDEQMKGLTVKLFKLSMLGIALVAIGCIQAQQPACAGDLTSPLIVGVDLTATGPGSPWVSVSGTTLVGFDIQVACQVAARLGYPTPPTFLNISSACFTAALGAGQINIAISHLSILTPTLNPAIQSWVKYTDDSNTVSSLGIGILLNPSCCQLWANVNQAIMNMAADGTLAALRTQFSITPNSFTPLPASVLSEVTNCSATTSALPTFNALSTFMQQFYCLKACSPTAPTAVTPVPGCTPGV